MLDAICLFDEELPVTYSVFKFQKLSDSEIERYRQTLICPACAGKAYYRKAAKDGKAACFGSRYHQADCREFKPSAAKEREEQDAIEVNQQLLDSDAMVIDFSRPPSVKKIPPNRQRKLSAKGLTAKQAAQIVDSNAAEGIAKQETNSDQSHKDKRIASQGLQKLLHSLIRGSDLATSDLGFIPMISIAGAPRIYLSISVTRSRQIMAHQGCTGAPFLIPTKHGCG